MSKQTEILEEMTVMEWAIYNTKLQPSAGMISYHEYQRFKCSILKFKARG